MDEMNKKYRGELDQTTRGELRNDSNSETEEVPNGETIEELPPEDEVEQTKNEGDSNTSSSENEFDRNQEDSHDKEIDTGSIENTQVIKEAGEFVAENEDLEQNNLPMCDDQVETRELPRNKTTELVNSKIKIHEEKNEIVKKTEEKEAKIRRIRRPKKTTVTKELIEMTRSGLINMLLLYYHIVL